MGIRRRLFTLGTVLLAVPLLSAGAQADPQPAPTAWNPTLLSSEALYDGSAVRLRYTDGVTVVAPAGGRVIFSASATGTATVDGQRRYDRSVRIVDPHAVDSTSMSQFAAAGRSVYADALAAGFSPAEAREQAWPDGGFTPMAEPSIISSGCVYSEDVAPDPEFEWSGCYKLYNVEEWDQNAWYAAGSGTARGWGTGVLGGGKELQKGYTQVSWSGTGAEIIDASPSANQSGSGNCGQFTIGLSHVVELSYQVPLCRDGWNVTWNRALHKVEWHGASAGGQSDTRSASGASTVRLPWSTSSVSLNYRIGWTYACFC